MKEKVRKDFISDGSIKQRRRQSKKTLVSDGKVIGRRKVYKQKHTLPLISHGKNKKDSGGVVALKADSKADILNFKTKVPSEVSKNRVSVGGGRS